MTRYCAAGFTISTLIITVIVMTGCTSSATQRADRRAEAAETRLQLALTYMAQGEMAAAQANLLRAQSYAPQDYRIPLALALYSQQQQQVDQATGYYQQALQIAPDERTVLNNYGAFLCTLGHYSQAQQQFTAALRTLGYTNMTDVLENSAYCFLQAGELEKAEEQLTRVIRQSADKRERVLREADRCFEQKKMACRAMLLRVYTI
ncbi:MAG: type IV pilus biogenesis/stability protein PilW [Enterobacteriaceae bacterium]